MTQPAVFYNREDQYEIPTVDDSNEGGAFAFTSVQPGAYKVVVTAPSFAPTTIDHTDVTASVITSINATLDELQQDLDAWIAAYNHERTHQGKMCCGRTPMVTFEDGKRICREKAIA